MCNTNSQLHMHVEMSPAKPPFFSILIEPQLHGEHRCGSVGLFLDIESVFTSVKSGGAR